MSRRLTRKNDKSPSQTILSGTPRIKASRDSVSLSHENRRSHHDNCYRCFEWNRAWLTRRERKQERDDAAIQSVLVAVNKTKTYIARLDRGEADDHSAEAELVALWITAPVHIRRTDPDLANRLQMKAEYWTNPSKWEDRDVGDNRIRIDQIADEARRLLSGV